MLATCRCVDESREVVNQSVEDEQLSSWRRTLVQDGSIDSTLYTAHDVSLPAFRSDAPCQPPIEDHQDS